MEYFVGIALALSVGFMATIVGLDRDRSFYPTVMIVVASYYALFAVMGGSTHSLLAECIAAAVFVALSVAGFKRSLWLVVAGLAGHGVFDFIHGMLITNPGVPLWWPAFCGAYDVVAAMYLVALILRSRVAPAAISSATAATAASPD
ncbi:MAG: hypothetical protein ABI905_16560 [Betaproteobacteria bacterium]